MKKVLIAIIVIVALMTGSLLYYLPSLNETFLETITHLPIDEKNKFLNANTSINLINQNDEDEYTLEWKTNSEIDEKLSISHDISLLFEDGRLKETLAKTKQNSNELDQTAKIAGEDSGHYEAITFHYGQLDYPNDIKKSVQTMSYDQIYILDSPLSTIEFFKSPKSPSEEEGKRVLDTIIKQNLEYTWEELIDFFEINIKNYHSVPLTSLYEYNYLSLPNITMEETQEMVAYTWTSLYQHYFLGIQKYDGKTVSPIGSSVPLILYHNTYSHIIIVFTSKDGEKYHLIRNTERF
ncbi:MAG: hypothetical protein ACK4M9_10475 [Anaerobacillus sp.]|uniref:hypothetical protein n=1 Tax=Anaerobacillus sp. TaxID=1872506 RepID=UPI00391D08FB